MIRRALAALSVTAFAVVALATAAFAHVSVTPTEAPRGGFSTLMFRVPTESDTRRR
jgi:uncharacterized protein